MATDAQVGHLVQAHNALVLVFLDKQAPRPSQTIGIVEEVLIGGCFEGCLKKQFQ